MEKIKKLFGQTELSWKQIFLFALLAGVYAGVADLIPALEDTSFSDISVSFEWWILFGIFLVVNCTTPGEAAAKTFLFLLISQPLSCLIQLPFVGWSSFAGWPVWTALTVLSFPLGFAIWYVRQKNLLSVLLLIPVNAFLALHAIYYLWEAAERFPRHLLSGLFSIALILVFVFCLFEGKVGTCLS